jgi:rare lipoprotein A
MNMRSVKFAIAMGALASSVIVLARDSEAHLGTGSASYYGNEFAGRRTANGEVFSQKGLTAAHRTAAFGTRIRVTNMANGRDVVVRVNDRGPWTKGRIIDVSHAAASKIGMIQSGTARVKLSLVSN